MAVLTHTVKKGESPWKIATMYPNDIAGKNTYEKTDTILKLNGLTWKSYIYVGQVLKLSEGGPTSSSGGSTPVVNQTKPTINVIALVAGQMTETEPKPGDPTNFSDRNVYVQWSLTRANPNDTSGFKLNWKQLKNVNGVNTWLDMGDETIEMPRGLSPDYCYATKSADEDALQISCRVVPIAATNNVGGNEKPAWEVKDTDWSDTVIYDFANNPPSTPPTPDEPAIEDRTLIIKASVAAVKTNAVGLKFNIVKDNKASIHTSDVIPIVKDPNTGEYMDYVQYQYDISYGSEYKVRACSVNSKGKTSTWSEFSNSVAAKPVSPVIKEDLCKAVKLSDGKLYVHIEWEATPIVKEYVVEYATVREWFEDSPDKVQKVNIEGTTDDHKPRTSYNIEVESGATYFFRLRAKNDGGESNPTEIVEITVGTPPSAPTTWSSSNSAFAGESMELNWTHNASDGSAQTYAQVKFNINGRKDSDENLIWETFECANTTNENSGDRTDSTKFSFGEWMSYKGSLYIKMDTTNAFLENATVVWAVRTAGITNTFSDSEWSTERTISIYEKPDLALSIVKELSDINDGTIVETLDSFPFYIGAKVDLDSYELQKPIGYHLMITANEHYQTIDDSGRIKTINSGDAVYSKYFDTSDELIVEMSANNIDLEPYIPYTVYCAADMSTGLAVANTYELSVKWSDESYVADAYVSIDPDSFSAVITPRCISTVEGRPHFVENIVLSIYRREYDGTLTEIAKNIPNNATSVTDPHPALDYARYRLVAKDTTTGAVSFYDMPGYPVNGTAVLIQWDEEWTTFGVTDEVSAEGPQWSGSMLKLPYNIGVTDKRKREVELIKYAGREHPVAYYGTHRDESSSWTVSIPKEDKETIYALRRLSLWSGNVYVREPSGMGYWANVDVSFNQKHSDVTIPITINVTRVEGGI